MTTPTPTPTLSPADVRALRAICSGPVILTQGRLSAGRVQKVHADRLILRGLINLRFLAGEAAFGERVCGIIGRVRADFEITSAGALALHAVDAAAAR